MITRTSKRKNRDFVVHAKVEPTQKIKITENILDDMKTLRITPVKWNPGLYSHINRFDVPGSSLKRQRELIEEGLETLVEDPSELIRPLKKLCITRNKKVRRVKKKENILCESLNSDSTNSKTNTSIKNINNTNNKIKTKPDDNNIDRPKMSLIEFLYSDKPSKTPASQNSASVKLSELHSWLSGEFASLQTKSEGKSDDSKALVLYKSPHELFGKTLRSCKFQTFSNNDTLDSMTVYNKKGVLFNGRQTKSELALHGRIGIDGMGCVIGEGKESVKIEEVREDNTKRENMEVVGAEQRRT